MSNRFNTLRNDEYVSSNTYVPMPLGQIAGMAKDYSDTYKANIKELDETNDLYSKVNAIDKHQGYKKALVDDFTKKTEELAERFASGQDTFKAERDLHKLKRDWLNNPIRQELENSYLNYGAYQKDKITKGAKYGEWYDNYISFKGKRDDGSIEGYRYTGMGERQNHQKLAQDMMDKIIPDKSAWDKITHDIDGNIIDNKGSQEYITEKRIQTLAAHKVPSFLSTTEGEDFARMINYRDPNADIEQAALEYLTSAGLNSVHTKNDIDNNFRYAPKHAYKGGDEAALAGTYGQTVPGAVTHNLTNSMSNSFRDAVSFDTDGNAKVDWTKVGGSNWKSGTKKSGDRIAETGGWLNIDMTNQGRNVAGGARDLYNFANDAAKATGYTGKINSETIPHILTEYNKASKAISFDYKLKGNEQAVIKDDILKDRSNYKFTNVDGEIIEVPVLEDTDFSPDTRVYDGGKSKIRGTFIDKSDKSNPKKITVFAENLAYEDNAYHNTLAKVQKTGLDYLQSGKVDKSLEDQLKQVNAKPIDPDNPTLKAINVVQSPTGNSIFITAADPNNRGKQTYYQLGNDADGKPFKHRINNLPLLTKLINKDWYATPEGKAEALRIAPKKASYEDLPENSEE